MNINQLEYFIRVAETLNFTKAAEKCFISQTAMTQQIKALEKSIGVPLFIRDKHHVELTPAGQVYLREARLIIRRSNEAQLLARLASEGLHGEITVGYIRGCSQSELIPHMGRFHKAYPHVKINFIRNNMSVLLEHLDKDECDLVIAVVPYHKEYPYLDHIYLESYPVMVALPAEHPLADKKSLTYQDLKDEDFIMLQPANRPQDQMEESMLVYENGGYLPRVAGVEGDPESLMLMVSIGMGISLLPEYITLPYMNHRDLKILPLMKSDGGNEVVQLEAWWKKDTINPVVEQMIELLAQ